MSVGRGAGGELMIMMIHLQLPKGNVQAWAVAISNRNNRGGGGCTPSTTDVNRSGGGWPAGPPHKLQPPLRPSCSFVSCC